MKTYILCVVILVCASSLYTQPQVKRGVYSASGSIGFSSTSSEFHGLDQTITSFVFSPSVAYFVVDDLELNCGPFYAHTSAEWDTPNQQSTRSGNTQLGIHLGLRYYFSFPAILPFIGASGGPAWTKRTGSFESPFSPPVKSYNIEGGFDYLLADVFALEPKVQYRRSETQFASENAVFVGVGVKYFVL